ncbi:biotin-dependent carboxyltransferase family protein, partial [Bacteroidota bacterium]
MLEVLKSGFQTTIQDLGRFNFQEFGMPISGVMDIDAYLFANWLVGNKNREAVLEVAMIGPELKFHTDTYIGITGAILNPKINGNDIAMYKTVKVNAGDILSFGKLQAGLRTYIAFAGGFQIKMNLGSYATYAYAEVGGVNGKALQKGDFIAIKEMKNIEEKKVAKKNQLSYTTTLTLRVLPSIEFKLFTEESKKIFF